MESSDNAENTDNTREGGILESELAQSVPPPKIPTPWITEDGEVLDGIPSAEPAGNSGGVVIDLEAVRTRIDALTEQFSGPVRSGRPETVAIGGEPPKHYGGKELLEAAMKPIDWQISQLWTQSAKILLASEPKAGKTYFVCDVAISLSAGIPLWDSLKIAEPCPVGIIAAEDDQGEIGRRLHRMCRAKGVLLSNLPLHWWPGNALRLNRSRDIDWIRAQIREFGIKLMIYDPMARLMDGDENSKECVAGVLNPASAITTDLGCSVMIVHHLGKDDPERPKSLGQRIRGSSDIRSWYTTGMFLTGKLSNGRVGVELEQRTSGKIPGDFTVRAVEKEDESVYGLGTIKLVANLDAKDRNSGEATNQQLIDNAAERIFSLAEAKGRYGLTISEIMVNLGLGRSVMNAAVKKLIREERKLVFEDDKGIPDSKVLMVMSEFRVKRPASIAPPDPDALNRMREPPPASRPEAPALPKMVTPKAEPEQGSLFEQVRQAKRLEGKKEADMPVPERGGNAPDLDGLRETVAAMQALIEDDPNEPLDDGEGDLFT